MSPILRYDPRKEGIERWLGSLETAVMSALWEHDGSCTVKRIFRSLLDDGRDIAYTTVMTVMARLVEKGILTRKRVGLSYKYTPVDADEQSFIERQELAVARSLVSIDYTVRE